jgi:hypothetical protein
LLTTRNRFTAQSLATEAQIVAAARIATTERVVPGSEPAANLDAPDLRLSVLTVFAHDGELPTGVHPGPSAVVGAATEIQLGVTGSALFLPGGLTILAPSGGYRVSGSAGGCESATSLTARADLRLRVGAPTALAYAGLPGGYLLASLTLGGLQGSSRRFNSGRAYAWLDIAAAPSLVNLHASAGVTFSTCAAGAVDQHLVT